ncbi:MAG: citrate lyase acyl carrier protein [Lachnospiraceae bacterium]|nr:citrate lyase acyl carrier protein [Lachnospiraceae bacterium]
MEILKNASAGTLESSDVYVEIEPGTGALEISLESVVENQFGEAILKAVREVLRECQVQNAVVRVVDRGALECVLRARVETAVLRAIGETASLRTAARTEDAQAVVDCGKEAG